MEKFQKANHIVLAALIVSLAGLVTELVGSLVLSRTTTIGFNTSELHPVLFIGFAITVVALILAVIGNARPEEELNYGLSSAALYISIAIVMAGTVIIALTITGPVLWPTNG